MVKIIQYFGLTSLITDCPTKTIIEKKIFQQKYFRLNLKYFGRQNKLCAYKKTCIVMQKKRAAA